MAFEDRKKKFEQIIKTKDEHTSLIDQLPRAKNVGEKKKNYTFSMFPSNRAALKKIANDLGYASDSEFLDFLIQYLQSSSET